MAYQAMFTPEGRITAIPTPIGENPPAEKQSDLFTWEQTEARKEAWDGGEPPPCICPACRKPITARSWVICLGRTPYHGGCVPQPDPADEQDLR